MAYNTGAKAKINGIHIFRWVESNFSLFLEMLPFSEKTWKKNKAEGHIKAQMGDICMLVITHISFEPIFHLFFWNGKYQTT